MILGVVVVAIFGESILPVKFLGDIFLNALKMVVIPLLFCSMIVGITKLGDIRKLGRTGLKTLLYFLATSSIAVAIGLILVNIIQPGVGFDTLHGSVPENAVGGESYSFFAWLTNQIPSNIIGAAAETKVLPIIVFALFFGGVLTTVGAKGKPVIAFFEGLNEVIMKIVHIIMWFAPIGIFGLVAGQLAAHGGLSEFSGVLAALGKYSLVVILGLLIHGVVILVLILKFVGGKNPLEYFVGMSQALTTAFATASSSATLPVTMDCVEEKNDVDKRSSSFVLPLGATINMDGTALYEAVAAMFIAQAYGIDLPILSQIVVFATAVLASVGAAGIPEAGLVTMVLVLQAVGLPLEGIGLILAIDWFLDRCRTTVNVWGDSIGAAVIATTAEIGLVDRRQLKKAKTSRTRIRSLGRRTDPRSKKRVSREPTKAVKKERAWSKGKKAGDPSKESARRTSRPGRKPDRSGNGRFSRKDVRTDGPAKGDRRGESRSRVRKTSPKAVKADDAKPDRGIKADKPPRPRQERNKSAYGRKRSRPTHARGKSKTDDARREKTETVPEEKKVIQPQSEDQRVGYEVPKFPETILDDLVPKEEDREDSGPGDVLKMASDIAESKPADVESDSTSDEESLQTASDVKERSSEPDESTSKSGKSSEETVETEDFSQLDRAILGASDQSDDRQAPETPDESEKPPIDVENDFGEGSAPDEEPDAFEADVPAFAASVPEDIDMPPDGDDLEKDASDMQEEPEAAVNTDKPDMGSFEAVDGEGSDISPNAEVDVSPTDADSVGEKEPSLPDPENEEKSSESNEATGDEVPEKDESDDESMKWGRQKRKKMNR
jgi:Na+/H+-dicarboxylate symporter